LRENDLKNELSSFVGC